MAKVKLGECECGGDIIEDFRMVIDCERDKAYDGIIAVCEKCGEDWTQELYG